jgi:hypothetical protein
MENFLIIVKSLLSHLIKYSVNIIGIHAYINKMKNILHLPWVTVSSTLKLWNWKADYIFTVIDIVFDTQGTIEHVKDAAALSIAR